MNFERLYDRIAPTVSWLGGDGAWEDTSKWSGGAVPVATDDVVIGSGMNISVTLTSSQSIKTLMIDPTVTFKINTGSAITLADTSDIKGIVEWNAGSITANGGGLTFSGASSVNGTVAHTLAGKLMNTGTLTHNSTGELNLTGGAILTNAASGTYSFSADGGNLGTTSAGGTVNNLGLFRKTGGAGTSSIVHPFNNTGGTVEAMVGTLDLPTQGLLDGGMYIAALGAIVDIGGTFKGTLTGSGAGAVQISSATDMDDAGATFNFPSGLLQWNSGAMSIGTAGLTNKGHMTLATSSTHQITKGTLTNQGTILHSGTGSFNLLTGNCDNQASATYSLASDADVTASTGIGVFTNAGKFEKTVGSGVSAVTASFNNTGGVVDAMTGTIDMSQGGTSTGGIINAAGGATIDLGPSTVSGMYTGTGGGKVQFGSGFTIGAGGATFNFPLGMLTWVGAAIDASAGTFTNAGTLSMAGGAARTLVGNILNNGTIIYSTTGNFNLNSGAMVTNAAGGVFELQTGANISTSSGGGTFINQGKFRKTVGTGSSSVLQPFNNDGGEIEVFAGILDLSSGVNTGGTYNTGSSGEIVLGNTATYSGAYTATSGFGAVRIDGLTITSGGATFNFPASTLKWSGGTIDATAGSLTNSGTFGITASTTLLGTFINMGTVSHTGGVSLNLNNGAIIMNKAGAVYDTTGSIVTSAGGGTFVNEGKFRKPAGINSTTVSQPFNNLGGEVEVLDGTLTLTSGANTGGTYQATAPGILFLGDTATYTGTYTGSGTGDVRITGLTIGAGGAMFNLSGSLFQWKNGTINATAGTLTNSGTITMNSGSSPSLLGTFENKGSFNHSTSHSLLLDNGAVFNNMAGATFDILSFGDFSTATVGGTFNNAGLFRKKIDVNQTEINSSIVFTNTGTVEVLTGELLIRTLTNFAGTTLTGGTYHVVSTLQFTSADIVTNRANVILDGMTSAIKTQGGVNGIANFALNDTAGNFTLLNGRSLTTPAQFSNLGTMTIGTSCSFNTAIGDYKQGNGTTTVIGTLDPAGDVSTTGGRLAGNGAVASNVNGNGGEVSPGLSPGPLTINGDYTAPAGGLTVELTGTLAGTQHDQLLVSGAVTLGGFLVVDMKYNPAVNDSYVILANNGPGAVSGTFDSLPEGAIFFAGGDKLQITYQGGDGNDVVLKTLAVGAELHVGGYALVSPYIQNNIGGVITNSTQVVVQRSLFSQIYVLFDQALLPTLPPASAFELRHQLSNSTVGLTVASVEFGRFVRLNFSGPLFENNSLIDGRYTLKVFSGQITSFNGTALDGNNNGIIDANDDFVLVGNPANRLFRVFGDSDGDGNVAANDFIQFRLALGGSNAIFDFDNDGSVSAADFIQFRLRFGGSI